ncbi:SDR family NAD(P)-dependent oxidoreductase [Erwinia persicina]|uniref:SDR family NAD(P)-dependent oxidoreductase n=1 Tax=Erwinia persicina TaxID=55211 RepID=UPI000F6F4951|nr:SDR family NAD(P)-dependent oxidoreductase [Erwinia persicina]AXU94703.1 hypothetical protein CI789_05310 [Erwinia persicina]
MNHLQEKTAVITGASSGIGAATALELARHGVNIVAARLPSGFNALSPARLQNKHSSFLP